MWNKRKQGELDVYGFQEFELQSESLDAIQMHIKINK